MAKLVGTLIVTLLGILPRPAVAQSFSFYPYDEDNADSLDDVDIAHYINIARCLCDQGLGGGESASLNLRIVDSSGDYSTDEVYLYLGDDCDNDAIAISEQCYELEVINHSDFNETQTVPIPANRIVDPMDGECDAYNSGTTTVFVIMEDTSNTATATYAISFDTKRPGIPADVSAVTGEQAVTVSWDPPDDDDEDIAYYDVLCTQDGTAVGGATPSFLSTETYCGLTEEGDAWAGCGVDPVSLVEGATPSPCAVCGSVSASQTQLRITGLTNHRPYQFAVVAVDGSGNVSPVSEVVSATPLPTTDFAELYAGSGGKEQGGFCFVATELYGSYDHPDVRTLRRFRDEVLARSAAGRAFIAWYYRHGRTLAQMTRHWVTLRALAWVGVRGLVWLSRQILPGEDSGSDPLSSWPVPAALLLTLIGLRHRRLHKGVIP